MTPVPVLQVDSRTRGVVVVLDGFPLAPSFLHKREKELVLRGFGQHGRFRGAVISDKGALVLPLLLSTRGASVWGLSHTATAWRILNT